MDAPPEKENIKPFIRVAGLLARSQVNIPNIFQQNLIDGFLLLADFGSECLLDRLNAHNVSASYQSAIDTLFNLQTNTAIENCGLPR
jgi:aminoglycoside/choline kinase family phosphotransferase